jgi:hypothetical protein
VNTHNRDTDHQDRWRGWERGGGEVGEEEVEKGPGNGHKSGETAGKRATREGKVRGGVCPTDECGPSRPFQFANMKFKSV